eukprot:753315-Pyramimonas_sp.AAC.1
MTSPIMLATVTMMMSMCRRRGCLSDDGGSGGDCRLRRRDTAALARVMVTKSARAETQGTWLTCRCNLGAGCVYVEVFA